MWRLRTVMVLVVIGVVVAGIAIYLFRSSERATEAGFDAVDEGQVPSAAALVASASQWPSDWKVAAASQKLSAQQVASLAENKILVSSSASQVFVPYLHSSIELPVFITSDALLNAFHVLFRESVKRAEEANAVVLSDLLRLVWENLDVAAERVRGRPELVRKAKTRARVVVGTAMALLGSLDPPADAALASLIKAEADRVVAARGLEKPAWLGDPAPSLLAIDYSRYKPRGFYAEVPGLDSYFRAVAWLQSIPFRLDNDEEFLSVLLLGNSMADCRFGRDRARRQRYEAFFGCYRQFIGDPDHWDLAAVSRQVSDALALDLQGDGLLKVREQFRRLAVQSSYQPQVNDQVRLPPTTPAKQLELDFRILSAYRTPDALLFEQTTGPLRRDRPVGLEVCAALGSSFAEGMLTRTEPQDLLTTIHKSRNLFRGSGLYCEYMQCLAALFDTPPAEAPALMSSEPWHIKSCQTALGGWAQLRHTWALQAVRNEVGADGNDSDRPVGFVEPNPAFFNRLSRIVDNTETLLKAAGAFQTKSTPQSLVPEIRRLVQILTEMATKGEKTVDPGDRRFFDGQWQLGGLLTCACADAGFHPPPNEKYSVEECIKLLNRTAEDLSRGDTERHGYLLDPRDGRLRPYRNIASRWSVLGKLCRRCEELARKQLRREDFNASEKAFLINFGEVLAQIMFYGGGRSGGIRHDAPRIVDVFSNASEKAYLEVGIGEPRYFYVLYPWNGSEVLARGAVVTYYEFVHPVPLNDMEWRQLLRSPEAPTQPAWVRPICSPADESSHQRSRGSAD